MEWPDTKGIQEEFSACRAVDRARRKNRERRKRCSMQAWTENYCGIYLETQKGPHLIRKDSKLPSVPKGLSFAISSSAGTVWHNYSLGKGISNLCPKRRLNLSLRLNPASFDEPGQYSNKDHRAGLYFCFVASAECLKRRVCSWWWVCVTLQLSCTHHPPARSVGWDRLLLPA